MTDSRAQVTRGKCSISLGATNWVPGPIGFPTKLWSEIRQLLLSALEVHCFRVAVWRRAVHTHTHTQAFSALHKNSHRPQANIG